MNKLISKNRRGNRYADRISICCLPDSGFFVWRLLCMYALADRVHPDGGRLSPRMRGTESGGS